MFGWVNHAAALDGFLTGMLYVPYALARTVARLLCPYCCLQWGLGKRWSRKDSLARVGIPITVLGRAFVCRTPAVVCHAVGDRQAVGHAMTPWPVLASSARYCGRAFVCSAPTVICSRG